MFVATPGMLYRLNFALCLWYLFCYLFIYIFLTFDGVKNELVQSRLQSVRRGRTHGGGGTVPSVIIILAVSLLRC